MRAPAALACALLVAACGADAPAEPPPRSALPADPGPLDALNRRHARLRQRMRTRAYGEEMGLTRAFVLEDRGVSWPLDLEVDECSTFIALGGGSVRDMTLTLYDGEGEVAATDTVEGEGGLVHVCPQATTPARYRPYYLALRAVEGAGAVMIAHFQSAPGAGEGFDGLFDSVLAPRVPFRDVEEHLARSRTALRARGFEPVDDPHLEHVPEGGVIRRRVRLEAGRCYALTGRSGEGIGDIDLFLFDAAGVEVARDLGADVEPSIEHCPEETDRYVVELRAFEGAGAAGVMVLAGPGRDAAPADGDSVDEAPLVATTRDPGLALGVLVAPLVDRGFSAPVFVSRDAAIVPGEVRTHDAVVGPGCALLVGTSSDEAMDLDLYLAEGDGREVDRDIAVQPTARVRACREDATVMRVAVKGYGRDGAYALAVLRAPAGIDTLGELRLEEITATYRVRGYRERYRLTESLDTGDRLGRTLAIEAGRCVAVAAAGEDDVDDVDLLLRDVTGALSASDSGPSPYAAVSRCAGDTREVLTFELVVPRGSGDVRILVLEATGSDAEPAPDPTPERRSVDREADD